MEFKYLVYAILVIAIIGFFFFVNYDINDLIPRESKNLVIADFAISREEIGVNEPLSISVGAEGEEIALISYSSINKKEITDCKGADSCKVAFSDSFGTAGTYQIKVEVVDKENNSTEEKKIIRVISREKSCIDGTKFNGCSNQLPLFCEEGLLKERCSVCGCSQKYFCFNDSCIAKAEQLNIESVELVGFNVVKIDSPFSIRIIVKNPGGAVAKGAAYMLDLNIIESGGKVCLHSIKKFNLEKALQNSAILEITIETVDDGEKITLGKEGSYDATIALYGITEGNEYSFFSSVTIREIVAVSADTTAPAAPSGLSAKKTAKGILLSWNPNGEADLIGYNIYESITIKPAYISYGFKDSVDSNKNSIEIIDLENKKYYFVITAVDFLGNESGYSEPTTIDLSCPTCVG